MAGIDARTGRMLTGWAHVVQSVGILITTRIGDRVMRRYVGSVATLLLGKLVNRPNMLRLMQSIVVAIDLFEPRFKVMSIRPTTLDRSGKVALVIEGEYRPRGHLGDPRPEGTRRITLASAGQDQGITAT